MGSRVRVHLLIVVIAVATSIVALVRPADADHIFLDVPDTHTFHEDITWLGLVDITRGCNSSGTLYCPDAKVTRGQMAAFLVRSLELTDNGGGNRFVDDNGSTFEDDIAKIAAAGITLGCDSSGTRFCPDANVTRGQMAAFLVRGLGLTNDGGGNRFVDDNGSTFEDDIAKVAAAGITLGCDSSGTRFCPDANVTRGQMAAFLRRSVEDRFPIITRLTQLELVDDDEAVLEGLAHIAGDPYTESVYWFHSNNDDLSWAEYNLSSDYSSFCAVVGVRDDAETNAEYEVEILADGVSLFLDRIALNEPVAVALNVQGALRLRLETRDATTSADDGYVVWGNAYVQNEGQCTPPDPDAEADPDPTTFLTRLFPVDDDEAVLEGLAHIAGDPYTESVYWFHSNNDDLSWAEYNLSSDYSSFCAVVGVRDDAETNAEYEVEILADGVSLFLDRIALNEPVAVALNVQGALRLRLETRDATTSADDGYVVWGNAYVQNEGQCTPPDPDAEADPDPTTFLTRLFPVDDDEAVLEGLAEVGGQTYTQSVYWFHSNNDDLSWAEYNLSKDYERFCSLIGVRDDAETNAEYEVEVLVDGSSLFIDRITLNNPVTVDVSVRDGLRLRLETRDATTSSDDGYVVFADAFLTTTTSCNS